MSSTTLSIIERTVEKTHIWLIELSNELGIDDHHYSYHVLRGVLHAQRDRLTVDAVSKFAAQLPTLIRGIYYEHWDPSRTPSRIPDDETFLEQVAREAHLESEIEASVAVSAVMRVLHKHMTPGMIDDLRAALPERLRTLAVV